MKWLTVTMSIILIAIIVWGISEQIKENMLQDDPKLRELRTILEPMFMKNNYYTGNLASLNNRDVMNDIGLYKGDKSYTINKQKVFLCLKDENDEYYSNNILIYVLLHEISHVLNEKNIGHTKEFHDIFEEVLELATQEGIYNPSVPIPQNYCTYAD